MRLIDVVLERVRQAQAQAEKQQQQEQEMEQQEHEQEAGVIIKSCLPGSIAGSQGGSRAPSTEEGYTSVHAAHATTASGSGVAAAVRNASFAHNEVALVYGNGRGSIGEHHHDEYKLGYD